MKKGLLSVFLFFSATLALGSCNAKRSTTAATTSQVTTIPSTTVTTIINSQTSKPTDVINLQVLAMNDVHGHIQNDDDSAGMARASYLIDQIRNEDDLDNTILIGNGDMFQETALSRLSYGRVVIECMNEMGFDMLGLGNHEFDWYLSNILNYFDGDHSNGEANFPLINGNVYENGEPVSIASGNVLTSTIVEKEGVKVGLLSYLGDVEDSINKSMWESYEFRTSTTQIVENVKEEGALLKQQGADIIIVNVHGGNSRGVEKYDLNQALASLKYDGKYLVDVTINGHTHTKQRGSIPREGGVPMSVIQSSGNLACFGRIDIQYDRTSRTIVSSSETHVTNTKSSTMIDNDVNDVINSYYEASKNVLEEVYCYNETYIGRYDEYLQSYIANLMMKGAGAEAAICNTGAIRTSLEEGYLDFSQIYNLNPFDNHIILTEISGADLAKFIAENESYEFYNTLDGKAIDSDRIYKLAIIDYVFYGSYFDEYRSSNYFDTKLEARELIISDLRLRADKGFNVERDYNNILIEQYPIA